MGTLEVVMLSMMGRMAVLGMEIGRWMDPDVRVCRGAKLSHLFMKQESQLVTYAAGPVKNTVIILLCDRSTKQRFVMSRSFQMKNVYIATYKLL